MTLRLRGARTHVVGAEKCHKCGGPIVHDTVRANEASYHPDCFVCVQCKKPLSGTFFTRDGQVFCNEDFQQRFGVKCGKCNEYVNGSYVQLNDKGYHIGCLECGECHKALDGPVRLFGGLPFHVPCLVCGTCKQPFAEAASVVVRNNKPHCMRCAETPAQ